MPHLFQSVSLSSVETGRTNNLKLIRFLLATGVILSHCYVLNGELLSDPVRKLLHASNLGELAVFGFFFLSGYLILKSGLRRASVEDFLTARALRIFPALICTVAVSALILGPLESTFSPQRYFRDPAFFHYFGQIALRFNNDRRLPGLFSASPVFQTVNQPLWTLSSEWLMYMAVLVLCAWRQFRSKNRLTTQQWLLILGALALTAQMMPFQKKDTAHWAAFFALGGACFLFRHRIWLNVPIAFSMVAVDVYLFHHSQVLGKVFYPFSLSYLVLVVGYHPAAYLSIFNRLGDYSYGLYIYAWPIQQSLFQRSAGHPIALFVRAYPCALILAILSWHLIEERALHWQRQKPAEKQQADLRATEEDNIAQDVIEGALP